MANLNSIPDLSNTASSNINYKGQSIRGTALASTIDSMFQNNASMLADFYDSLGGVATVSGTDTYTVTITEDWAALASGLFLAVKIPNANTGAATLNVTVPTAGALGAKAIRRQGDSALAANDMVANGIYLLRYSSTYNTTGAWVLLNPAASIANPLPETQGGTNQTTYTQGDLLYASAANTLSKLAKGSTGQSLTQTSTIPAWGSVVALGSPTTSTSGTSIDYTSIPSWVRRITIAFVGVSFNANANPLIQIGAGSVATTGYVGSAGDYVPTANFASSTAGFVLSGSAASLALSGNLLTGTIVLTLENSSNGTWVSSSNLGSTGSSNNTGTGGAYKTLSGTLDRVRITTVAGTATFDAGEINITYE